MSDVLETILGSKPAPKKDGKNRALLVKTDVLKIWTEMWTKLNAYDGDKDAKVLSINDLKAIDNHVQKKLRALTVVK